MNNLCTLGVGMSSIISLRFASTPDRGAAEVTFDEGINGACVALDHGRFRARDWTNQELADLARVQFLLSRAGVPLETERGITDEGDPWFVFCDAQGEVFVHICRLGMTYLLDGPSLETPLRGPSFDALVQSFIERATTKVAAMNVVPLNKANKVFLHPSVMLTALIWSLFLLNDQMTNAAYAATGDEPAGEEALDLDTAFSLLADALDEHSDSIDPIAAGKAGDKVAHPHAGAGLDKVTLLNQGTGLSPAVMAGLSAIAIACGLWQPGQSFASTLPETVSAESSVLSVSDDAGSATTVAERHTQTRASEDSHARNDLQTDGETQAFTNSISYRIELKSDLPMVFTMLEKTVVQASDFTHPAEALGSARHLVFDASDISTGPSYLLSLRSGGTPARQDHVEAVARTSLPASNESSSTSSAASEVALATSYGKTLSLEKLASQIKSDGIIVLNVTEDSVLTPTKVQGHVHDLMVSASSAVKSLLQFEASSTAADKNETNKPASPLAKEGESSQESAKTPLTDKVALNLDAYTPEVGHLIEFLLAKQKDIVVVSLANELVILDNSALDESTDVAYAHSWVAADGSVISAVGHYADYVAFGLL